MDKTILHCDLNSFFASVELLSHPELKNRPMAVCGDPSKRHGIILAKNEIAKKFGVKTAETIWQAKRKCPDLQLVGAHHNSYEIYSKKVNEIYLRYTNKIEPFGIDESWLDVTKSQKLFGSGKEIADKIRLDVKKELNLTVSVGVSFNKIFAKLASDMKKPDATTLITRQNFRELISNLNVSEMIFIGSSTSSRLKQIGISKLGELSNAPVQILSSQLGSLGVALHNWTNGIADDEVAFFGEYEPVKSVGNSITFDHDLLGISELKAGLSELSDKVSSRLKSSKLKAYTIRVQIKTPDFKQIVRQITLSEATNLRKTIFEKSLEICTELNVQESPVRLLGITLSNVCDESEITCANAQIDFFEKPQKKSDSKQINAENALEKVREKFGKNSIIFGNSFKLKKDKNSDAKSS